MVLRCPNRRQHRGLRLEILPPWRVPGRPTTDRCFVIADEGIQIRKPVTFVDALEGGWDIDLVELEEAGPKQLMEQ